MVERVLVTGGTGKTGAALVPRLRAAGVEVRIGTRRPSAPDQVRFDWRDASSFDRALDGVDAVYLVAPTDTADSLGEMRPFLEAAASNPRRLVLLSAAPFLPGGPMMGLVHSWLASHATDWAALRPSWFMQNFVTQALPGILDEGALYSATGDGRVPFIDAEDIAAVTAAMLTSPRALEGAAPILTGPEPLSYGEAAAMVSAASGHAVRHVRLSVGDLARRYESFGLPSDYAAILADMDGKIAKGAEDRVTGEVQAWTGRRPKDLRSFLQDHRDAFHVGVHN